MSERGICAEGILCMSFPWWLLAPLFAAIAPSVLHSLPVPSAVAPSELSLRFFPPPLVILQ